MENNEHLKTLDGQRMCDLCKQICTHGFTPVKDLDSELTCKYIPEVKSNSMNEPVLCSSCQNSLKTHKSVRRRNSSDVHDEKTNSSEEKMGPFFIKIEDIEIKTEEDKIGNTSDSDEEFCGDPTSQDNQVTHENNSQAQTYKCSTCDFSTKTKHDLSSHELHHESAPDMQIYTCDACGFKTFRKKAFEAHQLRHSGAQTYQARYKRSLTAQQLKGRDISVVRMYQCGMCALTTADRPGLDRHLLGHAGRRKGVSVRISEVPMYECNKCHYRNRHKGWIERHMREHESNSQMQMLKSTYKSNCGTNREGLAEGRQRMHEDVSKDIKGNISAAKNNSGSSKELEPLKFTTTGMDTDKGTSPYVRSEIETPLVRPEYFLIENKDHRKSLLEDEIICQICKQICTHDFTPVKDLDSDVTCNLNIPEVNCDTTTKPVLCSSCRDSLNTDGRSLKNSLDVQDITTNTSKETEGPLCLKPEEIDIKSEEDEVW